MEVYYREGEDEMEQPGVLPMVRVTTKQRERLLGETSPRAVPHPRYICYLSQSSSLTGSVSTNNMFIKN